MSRPLTTGDQRRFCQIEGWDSEEGKRHTTFRFPLPDGRVLKTEVSRSDKSYVKSMKSAILRQLEVDEATFWEVLRTGTPPLRVAAVDDPAPPVVPDYMKHDLLRYSGLAEAEIDALDLEEAEHLRMTAFTFPRDIERSERRRRSEEALEAFREP